MDSNFNLYDFILPAFNNNKQYTIIRAGRRIGKTYSAFIWVLIKLLQSPNQKGLWVDTTQANLDKYVARYVEEIMGDKLWKLCHYDRQKHIITLPNKSILDMGSAERPELLEGFAYNLCVLNEAGIILKKDGLWDKTIKPMTKNAIVKIIGTPKGKFTKYHEICKKAKNDVDWDEFVFTAYDSPEYTAGELERLKLSEAPHIWLQEYMAEFTDANETGIIKPEHLKYYELSQLPQITQASIHYDLTHTAKTSSDYSCIGIIGKGIDNNYYVIDWYLSRELDPMAQAKFAIEFYLKHKSKNIIKFTFDANGNDGFGAFARDLARQKDISLPLEAKKYNSDKVGHLITHQSHFVSGRVFFNSEHNQLDLATNQLLAFPSADVNDDFVDFLTGALDSLTTEIPTFLTKDQIKEKILQAKQKNL